VLPSGAAYWACLRLRNMPCRPAALHGLPHCRRRPGHAMRTALPRAGRLADLPRRVGPPCCNLINEQYRSGRLGWLQSGTMGWRSASVVAVECALPALLVGWVLLLVLYLQCLELPRVCLLSVAVGLVSSGTPTNCQLETDRSMWHLRTGRITLPATGRARASNCRGRACGNAASRHHHHRDLPALGVM
jgi:hypothetical protein